MADSPLWLHEYQLQPQREYGELVITSWHGDGRHELQVDQAPDVALCTLDTLRRWHTWHISGDRILVGVDLTQRPPTRRQVWYRVTGWDAERCGLILTKEPDHG